MKVSAMQHRHSRKSCRLAWTVLNRTIDSCPHVKEIGPAVALSSVTQPLKKSKFRAAAAKANLEQLPEVAEASPHATRFMTHPVTKG
jgi:hypothetical protein